VKPLSIEGAWLYEPQVHHDSRGTFTETFRADELAAETGYSFHVMQANCSFSVKNVIRGIHYADVPPGQAKFVTCARGTIVDVIVDIRLGSPTFGCWEMVWLDHIDRNAVFLAEGLGHAFLARSEECTVSYLCSAVHHADREHSINPLDPELGIFRDVFLQEKFILSKKDSSAPTLAEAREMGILPSYKGRYVSDKPSGYGSDSRQESTLRADAEILYRDDR
jgi:dTDP-4-dehydrorhamnose 3,5-epimerase